MTWSGGHFKIYFGMCDLTFVFIFDLFWDGCNKLWLGVLAIQAINRPGHLKVEVRVLLCFCLSLLRCLHLDLQFWRDWRSWRSVSLISEFLGLRGLLRLGCIRAFVWLPVYHVVATVICFEGSPVYLEK